MKHLLIMASGFSVLSVTQAAAQNVPVRFEGSYQITAQSGCGGDVSVGDFGTMRYTPFGLGSPTPRQNSGLSFIRQYAASGYNSANGGGFASTLTAVSGYGVFNVGQTFNAQLAITFQDPSTIDDLTQAVNIRGTVTNYDNNGGGCSVDFKAALIRRPE